MVDLTDRVGPQVDAGILVRTGRESRASLLAGYIGLSLVGATLAAITVRRRYLAVKAAEMATGVVVGRRARSEFWHPGWPDGLASGNGHQPSTRGRTARSMLLGSHETVSIGDHGPTVRVGYAGGANDG